MRSDFLNTNRNTPYEKEMTVIVRNSQIRQFRTGIFYFQGPFFSPSRMKRRFSECSRNATAKERTRIIIVGDIAHVEGHGRCHANS